MARTSALYTLQPFCLMQADFDNKTKRMINLTAAVLMRPLHHGMQQLMEHSVIMTATEIQKMYIYDFWKIAFGNIKVFVYANICF